MNKKNQKKFNNYMNEQLEILKGHHERIMLRILNKMFDLQNSEFKQIKKLNSHQQDKYSNVLNSNSGSAGA